MKQAVLAGLGLATIGISFLFYRNYQLENNWKAPPRQKVLQLLINLREALYPCLLEVSYIVQQQLTALNTKNSNPKLPEQLKQLILSQQSRTGIKIMKIKDQYYGQISEEDLQRATQKQYINDIQIQYHKKCLNQDFQKSFLGIQPPLKVNMPVFLTQQKIINLIKYFLEEKINRVKNYYQVNKQLTEQFLEKDAQEDNKLRYSHLKKLGFKQIKNLDPIFEFTVAKYLKMSSKFKQKYQQIIRDYRKSLNTFCNVKIQQ